MNRYPVWKYSLIALIAVLGLIFALPNLYHKDFALQISPVGKLALDEVDRLQLETAFDEVGIDPSSVEMGWDQVTVRFDNEQDQRAAHVPLKVALGKSYLVALNLVSATPAWLRDMGAEPMFLGLDLRGGVHFLMEVDMKTAIKAAENRYVSDIRGLLRGDKIRYKRVTRLSTGGILIHFQDVVEQEKGIELLEDQVRDVALHRVHEQDVEVLQVVARITEEAIRTVKTFALQQNMATLRKRVNELGVAEPIVQQQGQDRIIVQLPGVQDPERAKLILGATATLEFHMVDEEHRVSDILAGTPVPAGSALYKDREGQDVLLKKRTLLTGDYIIDAASGIDTVGGGGAEVNITLDSKGARIFSRETRDKVGKRMAVVFIENKTEKIDQNGESVLITKIEKEVINTATIQSQLGKRFRITGLDSTDEARDLALLLRAGALAAPINIIEERTVGPSLGQDNIERGFYSIVIGFIAVLIFMVFYYRVFGLIADVALALNLVLVIAMLSLLQATLTLPGIAGIVLTVGMAVDANVLIFERIREEIRNGNSPQASIHAGYEKALSTIADANITTLIASLVLFSFGTGPIKGFAVTLSLGIISSMFTAIMVTRALVNLGYGSRRLNSMAI